MDENKAELLHQLRSPIGALRSLASLLRDGSYGTLPEKAMNAIELIEHASTQLLMTAEGFLEESPSAQTSADLKKEISFLVEELHVTAAPKHLKLEVAFDANVPEVALVDVLALRNGVWNLLDNAIKYTDSGSVDIAVRMQEGECVITVRDTGRGMSPEDIANPGTGLKVAKRLVNVAGGGIDMTSEGKGKGAIATITLPITWV